MQASEQHADATGDARRPQAAPQADGARIASQEALGGPELALLLALSGGDRAAAVASALGLAELRSDASAMRAAASSLAARGLLALREDEALAPRGAALGICALAGAADRVHGMALLRDEEPVATLTIAVAPAGSVAVRPGPIGSARVALMDPSSRPSALLMEALEVHLGAEDASAAIETRSLGEEDAEPSLLAVRLLEGQGDGAVFELATQGPGEEPSTTRASLEDLERRIGELAG